MTHLPVISGSLMIKILIKHGWVVTNQEGSHVKLIKYNEPHHLVVPLHDPLKRGTLHNILKSAHLNRDDLL
jgi:predicted RNA binding protein YcfA (HicA-like mRNA interferase family)